MLNTMSQAGERAASKGSGQKERTDPVRRCQLVSLPALECLRSSNLSGGGPGESAWLKYHHQSRLHTGGTEYLSGALCSERITGRTCFDKDQQLLSSAGCVADSGGATNTHA